MSRKTSFLSLSPEEVAVLDNALKESNYNVNVRYRRRLQAICFSHKGWSVARIAQYFHASESNVWKWRRIYKTQGLAGLQGKYRSRKL